MAAKGSSRANCCCNGCESIPSLSGRAYSHVTVPINPGIPLSHVTILGHAVDPLQAACCSCLPKTVCVVIYDSETLELEELEVSRVLAPLRCDMNGGVQSPDALVYSATVPFRGHDYDLEFWMRVIDGRCYFCLVSEEFSVENDCQEITAAKRANKLAPWPRASGFCSKLNSDDSASPTDPGAYFGTEWHISTQYLDTLVVSIVAQNTTPITGRQPCTDEYGNIVFDDDAIKNKCDGCGCLCTQACVIVHRIGTNEIFNYVLTLVDGTYIEVDSITGEEAPYGPRIDVVRDPDSDTGRSCALKVLRIGDFDFTGTPPLFSIQSGEFGSPGSCPNPTAQWELVDADGGFPIIVHFSCAECGNDCGTITSGCCSGYPIPRILHCTITKGDSETSISCECLPITIPLVSYSGLPFWNGKYRNTTINEGWCLPTGFHDFQVQLECGGSNWILRFGNSLYNAKPCAGVITGQDYGEFSCQPIMLQFTHEEHCCGGIPDPYDPLPGPASIVFTITE
jgi:hypothetical protein